MSFVGKTIDVPWYSPEFGTKFQTKVPLFLEEPEFPYNTVSDRSKETSVPKTSLVRSAVSIVFFCLFYCCVVYYVMLLIWRNEVYKREVK